MVGPCWPQSLRDPQQSLEKLLSPKNLMSIQSRDFLSFLGNAMWQSYSNHTVIIPIPYILELYSGEDDFMAVKLYSSFVQLSKMRNVSVSSFRGMKMVNIREYYEKDGKLLPGRKGMIAMPYDFIPCMSSLFWWGFWVSRVLIKFVSKMIQLSVKWFDEK